MGYTAPKTWTFKETLSSADLNTYLRDNITYLKESGPVGEIKLWSTGTAPAQYLLCQGQVIGRIAYATLFAVIGTTYGVGDGSTTFALPDLQSRVPVGYKSSETEFNTLGKTGGSKLLQQHNHGITDPGHFHTLYVKSSAGSGGDLAAATDGATANGPYGQRAGAATGITINNAGTGNSQNLQPYITLNFIIKYM